MLFLSQAERADMALHVEDVDCGALVHLATEHFQVAMEEKDVSVRIDGTCTIRGDRNMVPRVILNLLSNAIRDFPAGGATQLTWK